MIGDWLESLLLSHAEANVLLFFVPHELCVSNASLLPLIVIESVKLCSALPQAL